ncbi:unnamed protein product [Dimorphilus gyrociliatus]|uniref:Essential MCU regulator, mitochondrial n=1 Tax=Dimorphilus gyrociliatus TaxID=2664684 RepID=A0A7I8VG46_9ANNE|nr:unnamed protein product [Dimorphilus gyrociliatus]
MASVRSFLQLVKTQKNLSSIQQQRFMSIVRESGALENPPHLTRFSISKVMTVVLPFIFGGAYISKSVAAFLEENDIFVPSDDDD